MAEAEAVPLQSLDRLCQYSLVSGFLAVASRYYSSAKQSDSRLVKLSVDTAETLVSPAISTLRVIPQRYPNAVKTLDNYTNTSLESVERVSQSLLEKSSSTYQSVHNYEQQAVSNVRDTLTSTIERNQQYVDEHVFTPIGSKYETFQVRAHSVVDTSVQGLETLVNKYVPAEANKETLEKTRERLREIFSSRENFQSTLSSYFPFIDAHLRTSYFTSLRERSSGAVVFVKDTTSKQVGNVRTAVCHVRDAVTTPPTVTQRSANLVSRVIAFHQYLIENAHTLVDNVKEAREKKQAVPTYTQTILTYVPSKIFDLTNYSLNLTNSSLTWANNVVSQYKYVEPTEQSVDEKKVEEPVKMMKVPKFSYADAAKGNLDEAATTSTQKIVMEEVDVSAEGSSVSDDAEECSPVTSSGANLTAELLTENAAPVQEEENDAISEGVSFADDSSIVEGDDVFSE